MTDITLNAEQQVYVLNDGGGCSCLGLGHARDRANQIAKRLKRADLAFGRQDFGALSGYEKYLTAVRAWGASPLGRKTWFDPAADPKAAKTLEHCRDTDIKVRLIFGDTVTGQSWLDEYDVVGRIARSTGPLKTPLLIKQNAIGGMAITTACLLAIIEWESGNFLFRHPKFRAPDLLIRRGDDKARLWVVLRDERVVARFGDIGKAGAYVAFMRGETVEPRIFQ